MYEVDCLCLRRLPHTQEYEFRADLQYLNTGSRGLGVCDEDLDTSGVEIRSGVQHRVKPCGRASSHIRQCLELTFNTADKESQDLFKNWKRSSGGLMWVTQ